MIRGKIIFAPKAEKDLIAISNWYLQQRVDLDKSFIAEVEKGVKKIERNPESFRFISRDVRRMKLKKFPYYMYFSFIGPITVLRIRHTKQQSPQTFYLGPSSQKSSRKAGVGSQQASFLPIHL